MLFSEWKITLKINAQSARDHVKFDTVIKQHLKIRELECFSKWHDHWNCCVVSGGDCFEGNTFVWWTSM